MLGLPRREASDLTGLRKLGAGMRPPSRTLRAAKAVAFGHP
jgi:hypothetical protein